MNKQNLERYADIKLQIKKLEAELDMLKPVIETEVNKICNDLDSEKFELTGFGVFTRAVRKIWKYSPNVEKQEIYLKELKKTEIQMGIAQAEEKFEVRFTTQND